MYQSNHVKTGENKSWNKGKLVGQKQPLKLQEVWVIRIRLQINKKVRDLDIFNLEIDSKLRSCDLVSLKVRDVVHGSTVAKRAIIIQRKTQQPMQFEIAWQTRQAVKEVVNVYRLSHDDDLFKSRVTTSYYLSTRKYTRIVKSWVASIGLDPNAYGTHAMTRTKASLIYRRTKNLRAVQLLLGHSKLESTGRYLGIEVDNALEMAGQTEV